MKRKLMLLLTCLFVGIGLATAQTQKVTGTVISEEDGLPVVGASILVKGTTVGTITDVDGQFTLSNIPSSAKVLQISYIGMQSQEVAIKPTVKVFLKADTQVIDEVMIVAYGTAKKSAFTGSASVLKADKIAERSVSNVSNALAGQVAGVQVTSSSGAPGASATIRVRGIGSMNASNDPLYVVDGIPFDGSISSINPADIESMTVLKDASANAIYGSRGANGVILITTKKANSKDAVVTVDTKWGTNSRAVPNYEVMDDPAMYYETFYKALYNSKAYNGTSSFESHKFAREALLDAGNGGLGYNVYTVPQGEYLIGTNFKLNPNAKLGYSDGTYYYTPDDWYEELFKNDNLRQEYNVSVAGSTDKLNYYMSAGYLDDSGLIDGSGFTRYTGRVKGDYQAKSWLKLGANLAYTYYNSKSNTSTSWGSSGNLFYLVNNIAPIYPMYVRNADGSIKVDSRGITVYDFGSGSTNSTRAFMSMSNPAITAKLDDANQYTDVINSKWYAIITPMEGLTITANLGANVRNYRYNSLSNQFYGGSVGSQGSATVTHYREFAINKQFLANYKTTIAEHHNIDALLGYEHYSLKIQDLSGTNTMLYNPWVGELGNAYQTPPTVSSATNTYETEGYIARLQYDYDGKYFASASYRRDASSVFHPDNRWGDFGSFGAAWLISSEDFMQDIKWIDMLKLKASYGIQGNDDLGRDDGPTYGDYSTWYAYQDQYSVAKNGNDFAVKFAYKGNKDITWETSYSFNAGADFELFGRRLNGTIEYFSRKTVDLLYNQPVPISYGYSSIPMNVGDMINKGVELDLNGLIYKNKNITWTANFNATHYKNEILDLAENVRETGIKGSSYIYQIGGSLYDVYMRKYAGVDSETGKALYYLDPSNGDYSTTSDYSKAKQTNLGTTLADVYGGFGTSVTGYGFDFSMQFSYQLGGQIYDGSYEAMMHNGDNAGQNWHKDILKAWTPENRNTNVPRLSSTDTSYQYQSSRFLTSSDYLSLNSIILGYTLPKELIAKMSISKLRVYFAGDNLGLLSTRRGLDPRQALGGGSSTSGAGNFRYSAMRSLSLGLNLTF
jgi:TonB-linked SusC/RagA family outer membrane protein